MRGKLCLLVVFGLAVTGLTSCDLAGSITPEGQSPEVVETSAAPSMIPSAQPTEPQATGDPVEMPSPSPTAEPAVEPDPEPSEEPAAELTEVEPFLDSGSWDPDADRIVVTAFVPDLIEDGGVCTLVAEHDGNTERVSADAFSAAQSTECGDLGIDNPKTGDWTLTVEYSSSKSAGSSNVATVEVTS